ncbi:hypothetical protein DOTSEDRAFT_27747 [Dothistroma septosporum NZE10]|uniref:Uncharacterized protein n=1 Tax=Dothistroma septosporum (strain NZE10 / CBS 128990) TaxID=675120 RepID=N1PBU6_DOTSN|nr:hypothetical protein DOTSEDRAFT_27747 [Dothistroma septosporum NZE10]
MSEWGTYSTTIFSQGRLSQRSLPSLRRPAGSIEYVVPHPDSCCWTAPPPYSLHDTASTVRSSRRDREPSRGNDNDPKVERLRRFLSFCLAVDYEAHLLTPDTLDKATWCHFISLFLIAASLLYHSVLQQRRASTYELVPPTWPSNLTHPQLEKHIFKPSRHLGINVDTSMAMLINFALECHVSGYRSNIDRYADLWDLKGLEKKLRRDRDILFDRLLPSEEDFPRHAIEAKHQSLTDKWFTIFSETHAIPTRRGEKKLRAEQNRDLHWHHLAEREGIPLEDRFRIKTLNWVTRRCSVYLRLLKHPGNELIRLNHWDRYWWRHMHKRERRFYTVDSKGLDPKRRRMRFGPWSACRRIRYNILGYRGMREETISRASSGSMRMGTSTTSSEVSG